MKPDKPIFQAMLTTGEFVAPHPTFQLSIKGKDWKGNELNEDTLPGNASVVWRGKLYTIGNRRHALVELYRHSKFVIIVDMKYIRLIKWK